MSHDHHQPIEPCGGPFTRREFLHSSLAFASTSAFVPAFLQHSALRLPMASAGMVSIPGVDEGRVLVVVQLSGGNDGLNTVCPFGIDEYRRARPRVGITERDALLIDRRVPGLGLHPSLAPIKEMYDQGLCSIVQGVGYPNPNRSHFKSMDIWHTAKATGTGPGWLGRYFDSECDKQHGSEQRGNGQPGISIGNETPLAMQGQKVRPISFENEKMYRWFGDEVEPDLADPAQKVIAASARAAVGDSNSDFLARTALDARVSSDLIQKAVGRDSLAKYPKTPLGRQLKMVAGMIRAELPTRVYYTVHGGFDTHAGQGGPQGRHSNLLKQFADAMRAFYQDLAAQSNDSRVLTMTFSEFGRRLHQNGSGGTDHGTAAPMFMFGPMVKPGLAGSHPSLTNLDNGDLIYTTDFRSVYSEVLKDWLGADARAVLGKRYKSINTLRV